MYMDNLSNNFIKYTCWLNKWYIIHFEQVTSNALGRNARIWVKVKNAFRVAMGFMLEWRPWDDGVNSFSTS